MAGEELIGANGNRKTSALLFLAGCYVGLDAMSTINSSPWTSENFGASPEKAHSARGYVMQSIIVSVGLAAIASWVGRSAWPMIGVGITDTYLYCTYERALNKGKRSGSVTWGQ